jgi:hypothetical protein
MANEIQKLPRLEDLHYDVERAFKNDQLNLLLNQPVPPTWVKDHPFANNVKYIPIGRIEFLLTRIFQHWKVEILSEGVMFQSVYVKIRLHYLNPVTGEWSFHDGLGAVGVQTDKGESASNLAAIKQDAIMKALPAAESYAIKDAAEKLGELFGKNLNRKDVAVFQGTYMKGIDIEELQLLFDTKKSLLSADEITSGERILTNKEVSSYPKLKRILEAK